MSRTNANPVVADQEPTPQVLRQARRAMREYTLVIEPDTDLGHIGWAKELPTVFADGRTPDECMRALVFALETALATMIERKDSVPPSARRARRTEQVNIRLTAYEKQILSRESARRGFRGVGDLIRAQAIDKLLTGGR